MDQDSITFGRMPDLEDRVSLRDVFDASYRKLVVQLYGVTGSFDEAEDVVQEAFVRAAASGRRFLRVDNPEAWLRTTAINVHRSRWRKLRNGQRARDRMLPPRDPEALEDHLEIITALRALPEPQRQVIALHYLADLPVAPDRRGARRTGRHRQVTTEPRTRSPRRPARLRRRRRRPCLSDCWRRSARRRSASPRCLPSSSSRRLGAARRRRRHAVVGGAAACVLAVSGLLAATGRRTPPAPQPAEDPDGPRSATPYPGPDDDHAARRAPTSSVPPRRR